MISVEKGTSGPDQAEAEQKFSFSADAHLCVICHENEGRGKFSLCPECRQKVAEGQAARERSRPAPTRCICCHHRFPNPQRGAFLCPTCRQRFEIH